MQIFELFKEESDESNDSIEKLQTILNNHGANIEVDGVMGPETLAATLKYFPDLLPSEIRIKAQAVSKRTNNFTKPIAKTQNTNSNLQSRNTNSFRDQEFKDKLRSVADDLGIKSSDLAAIIYTESRGNPRAKAFDVSVGLIGFTANTAKRLGTDKEKILSMSAVEQLDLVKKYYQIIGVRPGMDRGTIYMLTFLPAFARSPENTILGQKNGGMLITPNGKSTGLSMHKIWLQNPLFGRSKQKDEFTVRDVKNHINNTPAPIVDEGINEADINPVDTIELDVPLLLRMMEYAREDAKTDMDLHDVAEKMIGLSKTGQGLSMKDYESIVGDEENLGEAGNANIPPMPDISGLQPGQAKDLGGGQRITLGADGKVYLQSSAGTVTYNQQGQALDYKTPTFGGHSQTQNLATGDTTSSYNSGPISSSGTKNAQGQTTGFNATYKMGDGSVNIDQAYRDGQPTIQTRTGTGSLNRAWVKNQAAYNKALAQQPQQEGVGGNSSEDFLNSVEYKPQHPAKPKRSLMGKPMREGHGRYWCSTDKRWKERQGPKQSRG